MTERTESRSMPTTTVRIELVKQLRAEAKAAHEQVGGVPGVVAAGILHLAGLCDKAANEIERQDEDRAYGDQQAALLSETAAKHPGSVNAILRELSGIADATADLWQHRDAPDDRPVMQWDDAKLTLGILRLARTLYKMEQP